MREELFYKKCRIFFVDKRDDHLEKLGCRLTILQMLILWEIFRKKLECLYRNSPKGGRRAEVKISLKNLTYNLTASPPFVKLRENCVPIKRNGAKITRKWAKFVRNRVPWPTR
ncbi:MAG: hypothetical protein IJF17_03055 [Thermoguttaceae bacterium]|nr:hypothetical protein [Thermoguttaceae bacterium]